nr:farnesylcysteine lyase-like [Nicotiana tomentosiformis]
MSGLRQDDIMQVGGSRWSECVELEAQGNSGGIVVYWGKRRWSCMDKYVGHHSITTFLQEENSGFQCTFTGVYAPCDRKVITRINYGQSVSISGLAGAVSLAGSTEGLWSVEGGNQQMAAQLINHSDVKLHLNEEVKSVSFLGGNYQLNTMKGKIYPCGITVVATPLDELKIHFLPEISIPERKLQHTYTTFVRGLLNPAYLALGSISDIPQLVGTVETPDVPFSSISVIKQHKDNDMTYKVFSRRSLDDALLDQIFSVRNETVRIDWAAYPHYHAPEVFAPFILDGQHLYYVNAFENAASTMETSAVAGENIARLILSRLTGQKHLSSVKLESFGDDAYDVHADL